MSPKYGGQQAFLSKRLTRDINAFLKRRRVTESVGHCVLRLVGRKGGIDVIMWPISGPPPNLCEESATERLGRHPILCSYIRSVLRRRIFVLDHCIVQFQAEEPGVWEMIEAGGP